MRSTFVVLVALALSVSAFPFTSPSAPHLSTSVARRQDNTTLAKLPQYDPNRKARAAAVAVRNEGFIYGPSLIGEAAFFPNGTLGNARTAHDMDVWTLDREMIDVFVAQDVQAVSAAIAANGGLKSLDDYAKVLYEGQWVNSNPRGTAPGIMTNYTQDLLFSMERLSQNPYSLRLLKRNEPLPFQVEESVTSKLAGTTLRDLQAGGKLFFVDYSWQSNLTKSTLEPLRYGAAVSAYFFLHPRTNDFLPLAIKTNTGADLIYTPLDSANDWLLAKMMFNVNDLFHGQMSHLVMTHDVTEAVHQAALHTLSEDHPIMLILERHMIQGYSSRIVGEWLCFNPGGHWDQLMLIDNIGCRDYVTDTWPTLGRYKANYLHTDFKARGLINEKGKYPFKAFPFWDDASEIHAGYKAFFKTFVDSYYPTEAYIIGDYELQNWFVEATKNAKSVNKETLVEVLTHFGFLVSVGHHALNGGDPVGSKATLPYHLPAIFAPPPDTKGVTDLLPFLPSVKQSIHYIGFIATFNRQFYEKDKRTLMNAYTDDPLLARLNDATKRGAQDFFTNMKALSDKIRARTFDSNGLSNGLPFVYRTLDPDFIPFISAV
ncbi:lipoxygenase [Cristinia sonorae]|uniref:Manganese lipoxygenase n=1 Tax=Cristinia sonorae TaxID=1940300 RepID=A0A8K0UVI2_9AGAR|nr:lipoxygenase [Cristinia sonorae]